MPFSGGTNLGEAKCNKIGLSLAKIETDDEQKAIYNILSIICIYVCMCVCVCERERETFNEPKPKK